ncbi:MULTISPECIES: xanthine dehydrogenase family protein subunit M [unclassified Mesorhizobium]|uniref:FAD binding domain-containing protein n=1 Tax=unclassified Mesorhizobium TaxID=325217 RepID=UPI000FE53FA8|nr:MULTISPECIES: xanthine dehydrogenase family protein subunit M [unclassified Mesorhizobium]RWI27821.1 MAG: xanthine dehydrogenase family protein subunit M [Mesorhizobium sp.]RWK49462.1 MAG: xanthine dehydrogenase family protein subunit M [Mesorhizobium sp.]RWK94828.1 MAG: xanthine dehydrogenase family protein subunit M [Mesorhizobium sp.]TIP59223.1 MAG: xanthine dehydrogenase family protein subunit M [Mesorhizobium sp.]TIP86729.1 MAG: xanthine dehydrogenase family protein subunit M [Mesorhiz
MYSFNYHRAASVADAVKLLETGDAKLLSGGMTLIPAMKTRLAAPSDLVDLSHIEELKGIEVAGSSITIRAATTHHDVASDEKLKKACPSLAHMASRIGDPAVRYKGTIGGSIANNDPAADYPAALLALDATIVTNKREIAAEAFFTGLFETALEDGEVVTAVTFTAPTKAAYEKFRNPASRYAIVGVFVASGADGVRVAVTGAGDSGIFRSKEIEAALATNFDAAALNGVKVPANDLMSDIHASADYRANLIVVMAKRAVAAANA